MAVASAPFITCSEKVQILFGVSIAILGVIVIFFPFMSSIVFTQLLAIFVAGIAIISIVYALNLPTSKPKLLHLVYGLIGIVTSAVIYRMPIISMYSMTYATICYLIVDGLYLSFSAFKRRTPKARVWTFFNAVCSLTLAVLLIADWPLSGLYAVSVFVGIKLFVSGCSHAILNFPAQMNSM